MIDLYTWSTPNGWKASIALEEMGLPYTVHPIDIGNAEHKTDAYKAISPHMKIPAIRDRDTGITIFESGAVLTYLADKSGKLLARDGQARSTALSWLFFQVGQVGPYFGNAGTFRNYMDLPENDPGRKRFTNLAHYCAEVLEGRLKDARFLAGEEFSIADVATFPWIRSASWVGVDLAAYPHLARWKDEVEARPAVHKGLAIPHKVDLDDEATQAKVKAAGKRLAQ